jgi:hypothetical protein
MTCQSRHSARRSLRRPLLVIALVLHVAWMTLSAVPVAAAATQALATPAAVNRTMTTLPCHDGMTDGMSMNDAAMDTVSMDDHGMSGAGATSSLPQPAPAHLPCCAQNCACAAGLCAISAPQLHGSPVIVQYQLPAASFPMPPSRAPTPELRPPILR